MNSLETKVRKVLAEGIARSVFPGAEAVVVRNGRSLAHVLAGNAQTVPATEALRPGMFWDLASLTKVIVTTPLAMRMVASGSLDLDRPIQAYLPDAGFLRGVTSRHLLAHCSGLPAWRPLYAAWDGDHRRFRENLWAVLREIELEREPGTGEVYSDIGFLVLMKTLEEAGGKDFISLITECVPSILNKKEFRFTRSLPSMEDPQAFVPTQDCPWRGRVLRGEVDDENGWALGRLASHAGLFGTAGAVAGAAGQALAWWNGDGDDAPPLDVVREFYRRAGLVPGSDRCLGWDGRSANGSSSGRFFSENSIGHTGFTGTSLWIDIDRQIAVVLLTNRVHPTREGDAMTAFRPRFHDLVMEDLLG